MKKYNYFSLSFLILLSSLVFLSCSSNIKKAEIASSADPRQEALKLDRDLSTAVSDNIDVLAATEFKKSNKWLDKAKKGVAKEQKQEVVLDYLRTSRGYLEKAYSLSKNRVEQAPGLFLARQAALNAGAAKYSALQSEIKSIDREVSSNADDLVNFDTNKITELQERYVNLERQAVIISQLGSFQAIFNGAKEDNAEKLAPKTFKKVELSLNNAESVISTNVRNPQGFKSAVATARADTGLLSDVMNTIKQNNNNLPEAAALRLVSQNRKIKSLNTDLTRSASKSASTAMAMNQENQALSNDLQSANQDLDSANANVRTQKAIESARSQFSQEEAEAYQQGENLVIRLKNINFASGRSDLPEDSVAILAKVSNVAKSMNASGIKVEGHTDSTGNENQNKILSEQRANSVAAYFKSNGFNYVLAEGHGFQKPIATNKSKEGRALNRRVDIVITPDTSSTY